MKAGIIVPTRCDTKKLSRKILTRSYRDKPLIVCTWENAAQAPGFAAVVVATDDAKLAALVTQAGGTVLPTPAGDCTAIEQCAQAARLLDVQVVACVPADAVNVDPQDISAVARALAHTPEAEMAMLREPVRSREEFLDPQVIKVVSSMEGVALYFSRAPIPFERDQESFRHGYRLTGIFACRTDFLIALAASTEQTLERQEELVQLRALDMGARILILDEHGADERVSAVPAFRHELAPGAVLHSLAAESRRDGVQPVHT